MSQEFVTYQGVRMIKGWPEKIEAAQLEPAVMGSQGGNAIACVTERRPMIGARNDSLAAIAVFSMASFTFLAATLSVAQLAAVR